MGPNKSQTVAKAATFLRGLPDFIAKTREAGLSQKSVVATTLRLFPEFFEVNTSATGGAATVQTKARGPKSASSRADFGSDSRFLLQALSHGSTVLS